jgi:septal ring factor EnvC (AmiA/AmiB activator)
MQRLCDVCRGVYSNNSSFSAHQHKTGHKQIDSTLGERAEEVELTNDLGQLEDSIRLKNADIAQLNDSIKVKDERIASLEDSIKTQDAEFATLHDEIATLNDENKYLESNEYLKTYLRKLTPEAFDQLGAALFPERATVEDSSKLADEVYPIPRKLS